MAWGYNNSGQLGDGTTTNRNKPVAVTGLTGITITAIACGDQHTVALTSGGAVYTWGRNLYGQLGDGTNTERTSPVAATNLSSGVSAIACGGAFTIALKSGAVYGTGLNSSGQLGIGNTTNATTATAATGSMASSISAIACGEQHTIALTSGGAVYGTGLNSSGQLGIGNTTNATTATAATGSMASSISAIACGGAFTIALKSGAVYGTGLNSSGQLGTGNTTNATSAVAAAAPLNAGVTAIACGDGHIIALKTNALYLCGLNNQGQLGTGNTTNATSAVTAGSPLNAGVTAIAGGSSHTVVVGSGGVYGIGFNWAGQLGDGTNTARNTPVTIVNS